MADNYQVYFEASSVTEIFSFLFFFVILDFLCPYAATWSEEMMMGYDSREWLTLTASAPAQPIRAQKTAVIVNKHS